MSIPDLALVARDVSHRAIAVAHAAESNVAVSRASLWVAEANEYLVAHYPDLEKTYKHLHRHPELSYCETQTSAYLVKQLEGTGFKVTSNFGGGNGLVAVLRNGDGPTVLVRTEMDALPITEQTGLPYSSETKSRDREGNVVGIMHACGHDVHMTCWIGTAHTLAGMRDSWKGTLIFIAQPAEEIGCGADAMIREGLFTKFPKPDYCLALHCDPQSAAGTVTYTPGLAMANIDMVSIVVRGKGGHGAWPHMTVDPVVLSARLILDLQTLVSRENNPTDPLVLTVGTVHGGVKANVIPNEVTLQLTVRTTRDATRKRVLEGIERMAKGVAVSAKAPEPIVSINPNWHTPAVINDPKLLNKTVAILREGLGDSHVCQRPPMMGGEDFARFGREGIASTLLFLGTQAADKVALAEAGDDSVLPSLHSDKFAPVMEPTLKTGVQAMTLAVLNLVGKESTELTSRKTNGSTTARSKVR
ncbi:MAG: amidohydrolase [Planctomycetes bacterium]|nr:amidohydrolase [Planctomycetota bacterium]